MFSEYIIYGHENQCQSSNDNYLYAAEENMQWKYIDSMAMIKIHCNIWYEIHKQS